MTENREQRKRITVAVSCGDAAGISYEVVFKALKRLSREKSSICFLVIGDWSVADFSLKHLKLDLKPYVIEDAAEIDFDKKNINFINLNLIKKFSLSKIAHPDILFGKASLKYVEEAYEFIRQGKAHCLVTAPVNKEAIGLSRRDFRGHTEFLAGLAKARRIAMMIAGRKLKVTLITRHIPLAEVSSSLNKQDIFDAIELTDNYLKEFYRIKKPKIGLCALNPHAGEGGLIGREERTIIIPAARRAFKKKINVIGPLAADSIFEKALRGEFDAVICLYHDQGLIPLKMIEMEKSVNVTLGLPFVRTSPAHGTAYDIAYRDKANSDSFYFAVKKAVEMVKNAAKVSMPAFK